MGDGVLPWGVWDRLETSVNERMLSAASMLYESCFSGQLESIARRSGMCSLYAIDLWIQAMLVSHLSADLHVWVGVT